ncbi:MAG: hypothetical protein AB7I50_16265 [Vicinamibacterales bacterium]
MRATEAALRLVAGLLAAGFLAPFTLLLPAVAQGPIVLGLIALACVGLALGLGHRVRGA